MQTTQIDHLKTWIGRSEALEDTVTPVPVAALSACLLYTSDAADE